MDRIINGKKYYEYDIKRIRWWGLRDVLTETNDGKFIAHENDIVTDTITGVVYTVVDVDPDTGISKLEINGGNIANVGNANLWAYFDTNTTPTTITIDGTYTVTGDVEYAIAYKGIGQYTDSMSEILDVGGVFSTDRIPAVRVKSDSHEAHSVYNIDRFYTGETLNNGDLITLIVFDIYGNVVSRKVFTLSDVSPLNDAQSCNKALRSVDLVSPFLTDGDLIRRPITVSVNDLNFAVRLVYTDGSEEIIGMDNPRVSLAGMDIVRLNNTSLDHDIMLIYKTMGDPVNGPLASNGIITVPYHLKNYTPALSYNHKLQIYPIYINQAEGYRIAGKLTLADRSSIIDVTPYIMLLTPFNGTEMEVMQHVEASVDLSRIHILQENHTVTTTEYITLHHFGGLVGPSWTTDSNTAYVKVFKSTTALGVTQVTLTNTPNDWWSNNYPITNPMILSGIEIKPPTPTHIKVYNTMDGDIVLSRNDITRPIPFYELQLNAQIRIEFIQILGDEYIYLSSLPIFI